MAVKQGSLSINSENIFPIIKKWLYSDHDIFYRELISNGCDAVTKLKKLDMMGEYALPQGYQGKIQVVVDPQNKTLTFKDNGLGMTAFEVEEWNDALSPWPAGAVFGDKGFAGKAYETLDWVKALAAEEKGLPRYLGGYSLGGLFAVLALRGDISADNVMIIISMVVSFYFGTQHEKQGVATES